MDETLIAFGGHIKATGDGKLSGRLVRFSNADSPDLEGEYFTKATDFGLEFPAKVGVYYNHGLDPQMGKKRLARAEVKADDDGLFFETQLDLSDRYQARVYELAQAGRLGASSGAAPHLVTKNATGKATEITAWPLAEASLTVTPAEPRNTVAALKSVELESLEEAEAEVKSAQAAHHQVSPLLRGSGKAGDQLTLLQHTEAVASAVEGFVERLESRHAARIKSGRRFSAATLGELQEFGETLSAMQARLEALLEAAQPASSTDTPQADQPAAGEATKTPSLRLETLRLQSQAISQQLAGVL